MKKINSLQGLRALAFLAIFLGHSPALSSRALGSWGVSVFFCLSGFTMIYSYIQREKHPKPGLKFMWSKIKKLYPLHILTMLVARMYEIIILKKAFLNICIEIFLHIFLIQIWVPNPTYYATLNGVSWYLSVCVLLYLLFPYILEFFYDIRANNDKRKLKIGISLVIFAELVVVIFAALVNKCFPDYSYLAHWITYYCPPVRMIDFLIGCFLGYRYISREDLKIKKIKGTFYEIITLFVTGILMILLVMDFPFFTEPYIRYQVIFIPTTVLLVWLVAADEGKVSFCLKNKILVKIGDISPYIFLIHYLAIKFFNNLLPMIGITSVWLITLSAFVSTFIASYVWVYVENKLKLQ